MKVSILGGSGYAGGELLRILLAHPSTELGTVTSQRYAGEPLHLAHPNLRGMTHLEFQEANTDKIVDSDYVFTALPHGLSVKKIPELLDSGMRVVDLSADYRLKDPSAYEEYYGYQHPSPELLSEAAYGLPELHRADIKDARLVAVPGCMATAAILGLAPVISDKLIETKRIVVDAKIGSSGAGVTPSIATHHSERSGGVRPYKPSGHRHTAEIEQELGLLSHTKPQVSFTPHAVGMVRGILSTSHTFSEGPLEKKDVWKSYRGQYGSEPFVRIISDQKGPYGLPNPKVTVGTNFCDVGFQIDGHTNRLVVFTALDNLTKGAAGQAVQCYNIMSGVEERTGLNLVGLHP